MLPGIACGAILLLVLIALVYKLEWQGRKIEQNEQLKGTLDDIRTVELARDGLLHNARDAGRLRKRFTRRFL